MGTREWFDGNIRISRPTTSQGEGDFRICLADRQSGTIIAEIQIPPEEFCEVLFSHREGNCKFTADTELLGATIEHKMELVPRLVIPGTHRKPDIAGSLRPFEVDGWMGNSDDLVNHHHFRGLSNTGVPGYKVGFHRYLRDGKPVILKK